MAAAVSLASHVEQFGSNFGYKRNFSRVTQVSAPSVKNFNQLSVPEVGIGNLDRISATSARPDQRVNVRVPVARPCGAPLFPGQIAFVSRGVGPVQAFRDVPENAPAFAGTHVMSLEHLNDLLAQPVHHVSLGDRTPLGFFTITTAKSLFYVDGGGDLKREQARMFDVDEFFRKANRNKMHPVRQYALDGVVCTPSDEGGMNSSAMCNVAAKGPAPVSTHRTTNDLMRPVAVAPYPQERVVPSNHFLQPLDVMAHVYVVLVAVRVGSPKQWMFRYELVTSSNFQTNHGFKRFTSSIGFGQVQQATFKNASKVVLRVMQLGRIVDTNFGDKKSPSIVVSVNIRPFEATIRQSVDRIDAFGNTISTAFSKPLHVWNSFQNRPKSLGGTPSDTKHAGTKAVLHTPVLKSLSKVSNLKVLFATVGPSQADLDSLHSKLKLQIEKSAVDLEKTVTKSTKAIKESVRDNRKNIREDILAAINPTALSEAVNLGMALQFMTNPAFLETIGEGIANTIQELELKVQNYVEGIIESRNIGRAAKGPLIPEMQEAANEIIQHSVNTYAEKTYDAVSIHLNTLQNGDPDGTNEEIQKNQRILEKQLDAFQRITYDNDPIVTTYRSFSGGVSGEI